MGSGQQYWHDKLADQAYEESNKRRADKAKELQIPVDVGLQINKLTKLVRQSGDAYTYKFGREINGILDTLGKYSIE